MVTDWLLQWFPNSNSLKRRGHHRNGFRVYVHLEVSKKTGLKQCRIFSRQINSKSLILNPHWKQQCENFRSSLPIFSSKMHHFSEYFYLTDLSTLKRHTPKIRKNHHEFHHFGGISTHADRNFFPPWPLAMESLFHASSLSESPHLGSTSGHETDPTGFYRDPLGKNRDNLPPRKLTWNLKMIVFQGSFSGSMLVFGGVSGFCLCQNFRPIKEGFRFPSRNAWRFLVPREGGKSRKWF